MGWFKRVDTVFISVPDINRSEGWYKGWFGFERASVDGNAEGDEADYRELRVGKGETRLTLLKERPARPNRHLDEQGHVPCFNFYSHAEDLHEGELCKLGVKMTEAMDVPWMRVCEFTDIDGNVIGICHERETSLFFTPSIEMIEPMFHRVLAVFLPVEDLAASICWYVDVLGWTLVNNWGGGADFRVGTGETIVTMIQMKPEVFSGAAQVAGDRPYFSLAVDDIHAAHGAMQTVGVETTPLKIRAGEVSTMFNLRSPEGLLIAVRGEGVKVHA